MEHKGNMDTKVCISGGEKEEERGREIIIAFLLSTLTMEAKFFSFMIETANENGVSSFLFGCQQP